MRVLRLRFQNLNSLAGVWEIDFTHPDYVSSGIFAITGPTGAGKTTVLDAICLALYGQTPRLDRVTQSDNEIMSRQTGECFAEIEFETAKGRFRCHWGQHRSRRSADGQLQSPRHEIAEVESGIILESKLKAVAAKVEDVTGMDFARFTRSMLLAQGGFAAFLQAGPDQRAPILEQITGTEIYSRISIKAHERTSEERRKLAELRAELDGIRLLSQEEELALRFELAERQTRETALAAELGIVRQACSWRERIAALEGELLRLEQDQSAFSEEKKAAAPGLAQVALAGSALKIAGEHARISAVRKQQQLEQAELKSCEERLPDLQHSWQAAFDQAEQAALDLARVEAEQARGGELIRATRELDVRLGEFSSRLTAVADEIEHKQRQTEDYRRSIAGCDGQLNEAAAELRSVERLLEEQRADAGLVQDLTGIEQRLKTFQGLDLQSRAVVDKLSRQAAVITAAGNRLEQSEAACQGARQAVARVEEELKALYTARETLLQGRELPVWRQEADALAVRLGRLLILGEAIVRIGEAQRRLAELVLQATGLEQKQQDLLLREEHLVGEYTLRDQLCAQQRDKLALLNRVRDLEDERSRLVDGAPCPLCGSSEHPYAAGNLPQPDPVKLELERSLADLKGVGEQLANIRLEQVAVSKDLEQTRREQLETQERLERDDAACRAGFAELGLNSGEAGRPDVVRKESEICQGLLQTLRDVVNRAEELERSEQAARSVLNGAKDELSLQEQARIASLMGHEAAVGERKRLEDESIVLREQRDRALGELQRAVEPYDRTERVPERVDSILEDLDARRKAWLQRLQTKEALEKGLTGIAAEKEKLGALLAEAEKALADREQQRLAMEALRAGLVEQRLELYGQRDPDSEEKLLADAVRQAGQRRDEALQIRNRLQADLDVLNQQIQRLREQISLRSEQLLELEPALALHLNEAGFADEEAFMHASLPRERFDELVRWAEDLRNREAALQARRQDRRQALELELARNLTDKGLDQLRQESENLAGCLGELQKTVGALDQQLRQHDEQRQRHHHRLQQIDACKRECERWERLHSLIGSGDGKKFRNFAQGLTFELMVAHANRQLQKMSDRYILVRDDSEPLELNVIDNYRAGDIRSTRNLSGGESFIASLALSLGLSSMSSRNVRVDSLFLDEGFGTLDEDALEAALETLSALQQEGKLIGIISHIPALKERIGIQIQVEPGSAGRSTLSGPGCSRG